MPAFLIYELKVAVCLAVFYLFFRLLISRDALHRLNRCILVCSVVVSFILPLCVITIHRSLLVETALSGSLVQDTMEAGEYAEESVLRLEEVDRYGMILPLVYYLGVILVIVRILFELVSLKKLEKSGERHKTQDGYDVIVLDSDTAPFSWFGFIFLSREDYDRNSAFILEHEKAHIRFMHAPELMAVNLLSAFQWFNPVIWLLIRELRAIYEYEADDAVLSKGADIREYQYSLIKKAVSTSGYSITNSFNHSILKNRITMMSKSKKRRRTCLKALYVLPLLATALMVNAKTIYGCEFNENSPAVDSVLNKNELVFTFRKTSESNWRSVNGTTLYFEGMPVSLDEAVKIVIGSSRNSIPVSFILNGEIADAGYYFKQVREALSRAVDELNSEITVEIRKVGKDDCSIFVDDVLICVDDLSDTLSKSISGRNNPVISITADPDIRYGILEDVKDEMRKLGGVRVRYVCRDVAYGSESLIPGKLKTKKTETGVESYDFGPLPSEQVYYVRTNADDNILYGLYDGSYKVFNITDRESRQTFIDDMGKVIGMCVAEERPYIIAEQHNRYASFYAFAMIDNAIKQAYHQACEEYSVRQYSKSMAELSVEEAESVLNRFPFRVAELKAKNR